MNFLSAITALALSADIPVGPTHPDTTVADGVRSASSGDRLLLDPGTYLEDGIALNNKVVTIEAVGGAGTATIELTSGPELFDLKNGAELTLTNLNLNMAGVGRLADLRSNSAITLNDSSVYSLNAPAVGNKGGGIKSQDGTVTLNGSSLEGAATGIPNGGLVYLIRSSFTMTGGQLTLGFANTGAAITGEQGSTIDLSFVLAQSNLATDGSVVWMDSGSFTGNGLILSNNVADRGTILCLGGTNCDLTNTYFENNLAMTGGMLDVDGTTTSSLSGTVQCGAISGGLLLNLNNTTTTIERTVFYDNALDDAQAYVGPAATATFTNNHFVGTTTVTDGAVMRVAGTVNFKNNLVAYNTATGDAMAVTGTLNEDHNLWFQNLDNHASVPLDATDLIDIDPVIGPLTSGACDLTEIVPQYGSPAIDAGDPTTFDDDGTIADIGAFGNLIGNPTTDGDDDDGDGIASPEDCDDLDPLIFPGAVEITCNAVDENCNGNDDDNPDADGDGVGACDGDCDDNDPDASELLDVYRDEDLDGWGRGQNTTELCGLPFNGSLVNGDCNDNDASIYPGATEISGDAIDQDCDGDPDFDGDGDGSPAHLDCDDTNPDRSPDATDIPLDGKDQDCTGFDAGQALIGGAGWECAGCNNPGGGGLALWWLPLVVVARRRRN